MAEKDVDDSIKTYVFKGITYRYPKKEECEICPGSVPGSGELCEPCERFPIIDKKYTFHNLKNYPKDGNFLEILGIDIPVRITKGEDCFKNRLLWNVYCAEYASNSFKRFFWENVKSDLNAKSFKEHEKAINFAKNIYKKWLLSEIKKVDNLNV